MITLRDLYRGTRLTACAAALLLITSVLVGAQDPTAPAIVPAHRQANKVAIITVEGEIDMITLRSLERRVEEAKTLGCDAVVFEIDTNGGSVNASLDICHLIENDAPRNSVAWVRPKAYSAGTIIALTCREIVIAPGSRMGDAAPIRGSPFTGVVPMPTAERAKQESPILERVIDSARRHGYDEKLVQSFVSVGVELWLIEHAETGERVFVDRAEYEVVFGEAPPTQIPSITPTGGAAKTVRPWQDRSVPPADASPPDPDEQLADIDKYQPLPPSRDMLTADDRGKWTLVRQVVSGDRLLTISTDEAVHYGIATQTVSDVNDIQNYFGAAEVIQLDRSWSESFTRFLVSWPVRIILIIVFLVCLFAEMAAPGVGLFGIASAAALVLLLGAPYVAGLAQWWEIILIIVGLLLIAVEIFLLPGIGIAGLLGVVGILVGLVGTFVSGDIDSVAGQGELATGLGATVTAIFASMVGMWLISRHLDEIPVFRRLTLRAEVGRGAQATTTGGTLMHAVASSTGSEIAVGSVGKATTDLRPSGRAMFDERMVDVQSVSGYIESGKAVRVVTVGAMVIEVEAHEA